MVSRFSWRKFEVQEPFLNGTNLNAEVKRNAISTPVSPY